MPPQPNKSNMLQLENPLTGLFRFYFPHGWTKYAIRWSATVFIMMYAPGWAQTFMDGYNGTIPPPATVSASSGHRITNYDWLCTKEILNVRNSQGQVTMTVPQSTNIANAVLVEDSRQLTQLQKGSGYIYGSWYQGTFPDGSTAFFNGNFVDPGKCQ